MAYFTTSYALGTGTTNTAALLIWRALNDNLIRNQLPMSGDELSAASGVPVRVLDSLFAQVYYQKCYGYRRFETLEQWRAWAEQSDLLFVPGKHDIPADPDDEEDADDYDEADDE